MDHVYVMRDSRNYNDFKVGLSINPLNRQKQLYRTNTPLPLDIYTVWAVCDHRKAEKVAHEVLKDHRIYSGREFFEVVRPDHNIWFPGIEACKDLLDTYLYALCDIIEDSFDIAGIAYHRITDHEDLVYSISLDDIRFMT